MGAHCIEEEGVLHTKRSTVAIFHLVTFFAAALERALGVGADLRTRREAGTLVDVLTEARGCHGPALLAAAGRTLRGWQAGLVGSTGVACSAGRLAKLSLVAAIETIMEAVTSSFKGQAVASTEAAELRGSAAGFNSRLSAVSLVAAVAAVFLAVAQVSPRHTLATCAASERVLSALWTIFLVRVVRTFPSSVAPRRVGQAL